VAALAVVVQATVPMEAPEALVPLHHLVPPMDKMVKTKTAMAAALEQVAEAIEVATGAIAVQVMLAVVVAALAPALVLLLQTQLDVFLVGSTQLIILLELHR
jgi:hypothetical protein